MLGEEKMVVVGHREAGGGGSVEKMLVERATWECLMCKETKEMSAHTFVGGKGNFKINATVNLG